MQVEIDNKGRVLLPSEVRKKMKARRFELRVDKNSIIMECLPDPESVRGKYKDLLKGKSMSEIEEDQERLISKNTR